MMDTLIFNPFLEWVTGIINDLVNAIMLIAMSFNNVALVLLTWAPVVQTMLIIQGVATAVLIIKAGFDGLTRYIIELNPSDEPPLTYGIKVGAAAAVIWLVPIIVRFTVDVGALLTNDFRVGFQATQLSGGQEIYIIAGAMAGLASIVTTGPVALLIGALIGTGLAILVLLVVLQLGRRASEIAVMVFFGPPAAINITSADQSMFKTWARYLVALVATQALQMIMLAVFLNALLTGLGAAGVVIPTGGMSGIAGVVGVATVQLTELVVVIGLGLMVLKLPKIGDQMAHTINPTGAASLGMQSASMGFMMVRGFGR